MSSPIRLFLDAPLTPDGTAAAGRSTAHYLAHVMRRRQGDKVLLFNGRDGEVAAEIAVIDRNAVAFALGGRTRPQAQAADCRLCFAPVRRDATEMIVQKATELGVSELRPVLTARTQTRQVNRERLFAIAREAAEQSERLTVPAITAPATLATLLSEWPQTRTLIVAAERRDAPPLFAHPPPCALLVGPEGGLAPEELDALAAHPFVSLASLGPLILRAETAAIAGLARLLAGTEST